MSEERKKRVTKSHFEGNFKALYDPVLVLA